MGMELGVPTRACEAGQCVTVTMHEGLVTVDDDSSTCVYTYEEWNTFIAGVKDGKFDL
jgi:hypothetical protein